MRRTTTRAKDAQILALTGELEKIGEIVKGMLEPHSAPQSGLQSCTLCGEAIWPETTDCHHGDARCPMFKKDKP